MDFEIKRKYLTITEKLNICKLIVQNVLTTKDEENIDKNYGMLTENFLLKQVCIDASLLEYYCDADLENVSMDKLYENGTIDLIRSQIPNQEIQIIESLVNQEISQRKEIHNSLAGVVNRILSNLIEKIPDEKAMQKMLKNAGKELNKLNPNALDAIKSAIDAKGIVKQ